MVVPNLVSLEFSRQAIVAGVIVIHFRKKIKPSWTFETRSPNEVIWKLLISPSGILAGEERNIENKTGSLFAIDVAKGRILWRHVTMEEPWWFASEQATDDTLYVQTFRKPDLPEPKGIIALNIHDGRERWKQPDLSFLCLDTKGKVYAMRQGYNRREYFALDSVTGMISEEFGEDDSEVTTAQNSIVETHDHSYYASSLGESEHEYLNQAKSLLREIVSEEDIRGAIDYLEFGRYLIFSYHARIREGLTAMMQNLLSNELLILDKNTGDVLFSETLHRETPLPIPDNFFVTHQSLIYVKEKRTIVGVSLP